MNAEDMSACNSASRRVEEPQYFSNIKDAANREVFRTYDNRNDNSEDRRISRSDLAKPYLSQYGRELSEKMETERRAEKNASTA